MTKYQPLADHLAGRSGDEWRASFAEVEAVLGFSLPKTATTSGAWWSNDDDKPHKAAWLAPGWRVADVDRRDGKVVFARTVKMTAKKAAKAKPATVAAITATPEPAPKKPPVGLIAAAGGVAALVAGLGLAALKAVRRR